MVTILKSFSFLLLWGTILVSAVDARSRGQHQHRDDLCDIYTENYQCPTNSAINMLQSPKQEEIPSCVENLVDATIALMDRGDQEIELTEKAVMLIGTTGTGKTTLTYFLAGDNSKLIAYKKALGTFLIKDCNGKISGNSTIVSATIFPELLIEPLTTTAFYDNPGFDDTRDVCTEIAIAYFIRKVAENVRQLKFVLVTNEPSLQPGLSRDDLVKMLNSVIKFLPNVEKYGKGLGLIGTKLKIDAGEVNENGYIERVTTYLRDNLEALAEVNFDDPDGGRKAQFIVNTLINSGPGPGSPSRIGLFRTPVGCGPLSDLDYMQSNKENMTRMIDQSLDYVDSSPDDFAFSLSDAALRAIGNVSVQLVQRSKSLLETLAPALTVQKLGELGPLGVFEKRDNLNSYIIKIDEAETSLVQNGFENDQIKTHVFIKNLLEELVNLGLDPETSANYSSKLLPPFQFFDLVGEPSFLAKVDVDSWLKPLALLRTQMVNEEKWNELLINLWLDLTALEYQVQDKGGLKSWWQTGTNSVTQGNFPSFWDKFNITSAISNRVQRDFITILQTDTGNKLSNLNDLLSTSLEDSFECRPTSADTTVSMVTGTFVTLSNIMEKGSSCFTTNVTKTVTVYAAHTIFIDEDFKGTDINWANSVDLTIISPTLWYYGSSTIVLDGGTGLPGNLAGGLGGSGGPGKPGGRAGNLISIGQKFSGTIRNSARGGRGGNGAKGEKGVDGADGVRKDFFGDDEDNDDSYYYPPKSECEATSGKIKPSNYYREYGYWCDDQTDNDWCKADNTGAGFVSYGGPGTKGGDGGHGGQAGKGGKGGHLYTVNVESGSKEDPPGVDGIPGEMGVGGAGGIGGWQGDELYANIDDVQRNGEKWCKVIEQQHQGGETQARDGNTGITGANPASPHDPDAQIFNPASVVTQFLQFKTSVSQSGAKSNQFLSNIITQFESKGDQALLSIF